jgi:acyl carrier protein
MFTESVAIRQMLMGAWQELLGVANVNEGDNFLDSGGNSLVALQIVNRLRQAFDVEVPIDQLLGDNTFAGLVRLVENATAQRTHETASSEESDDMEDY